MSEQQKNNVGSINWVDLTVADADKLRDFYAAVVGWSATELEMGGYSDFCMNEQSTERAVAGICHARGLNAGAPPVWLIYITVANLDESIARCVELGGEVVAPPRTIGKQGRYCIVRDPAGAVAGLFEYAA